MRCCCCLLAKDPQLSVQTWCIRVNGESGAWSSSLLVSLGHGMYHAVDATGATNSAGVSLYARHEVQCDLAARGLGRTELGRCTTTRLWCEGGRIP